MKLPESSKAWANRINMLEKARLSEAAFPRPVEEIAKLYSAHFFPNEPITKIKSLPLEGCEGSLKQRKDTGEWGIIYNKSIFNPGRMRFTITHELGHYFAHRQKFPDGVECTQEDMLQWDSLFNRVEAEANGFAATLLMPLDDFRTLISDRQKAGLGDLSGAAQRYGVSLTAAALRWLEYTQRRALLVVSREGYIRWARSSPAALRTGGFIKTAGRPPIEVPSASPSATKPDPDQVQESVVLPAGTWFPYEAVEEFALSSDRYDLNISLLHLRGDGTERWRSDADFEPEDTFDAIHRRIAP